MTSPAELASGKLVLDEPAPGAARLAIRNPARRGALDHELLDTLAETVAGLDARCLAGWQQAHHARPARVGL